jgi:hypothetical protein
MEEFVSCGVWPLAANVNFEHVKVGAMSMSKIKVPCPDLPFLVKMVKMTLSFWRGLSMKIE